MITIDIIQNEEIIPLAICNLPDNQVCVAALNNNGQWIRPCPVYQTDIVEGALFNYLQKTILLLKPLTDSNKRLEDRAFFRDSIRVEKMKQEWVHAHILKYLDQSVEDVFERGRSAGIVCPIVKDLTYKRGLGGKKNIRISFEDGIGKLHNFIVVENRFKTRILEEVDFDDNLEEEVRLQFLRELQNDDVYFTITLMTKNSTTFPGPYDGCHPLISGIHHF